MSEPYSPGDLQARLFAAAPPDLDLTFRPMFGGMMAYAQGRPFASLSDVGLALRLAETDCQNLLAVPGTVLLRYQPDKPTSRSYVVVPLSILEKPKLLAQWAERSARHAVSQPLKKAGRNR